MVKAGEGRLGGGRVRALWSWLSLAKVSNIIALDFKETSPCSLSPAWDTSTPASHQSRSERTARIFENRRLELAELHPVKLTVSGEILPWSETNLCHSGGSWPTHNKEHLKARKVRPSRTVVWDKTFALKWVLDYPMPVFSPLELLPDM